MLRSFLLLSACLIFIAAASGAFCEENAQKNSEATSDQNKGAIASAKPSEPGKPYTSLIIDSSGLKLDRCMSPKIRRSNGTEVWGTVSVDLDFVEDHGIVAYCKSLDEAKKNTRCGLNPIIIKALDRAGGKFYSDPVISDADAAILLAENSKSGFMDKFNVIFVKDGRL